MIQILQLGTKNWQEIYQIPENIEFTFAETFFEAPQKQLYDLVFIDRPLFKEEIGPLHKVTRAYSLFFTKNVPFTKDEEYLFQCKKGKYMDENEIQNFLLDNARNYFATPYGEKFRLNAVAIAQGFQGRVKWDGNYSVTTVGEYGEEFNQIFYWRNNIPVMQGQAIDFWLEYEKDPEVEIELCITQFARGSISREIDKWVFSEEDLKDIVTIDCQKGEGPVFISILAKGKGKLSLIALHDRYSRRGHGNFLPGGERYVTSNREEIFAYFDPGDLKPPLTVYFSGYKTQEGFEGYYMMRKLGCPFLLLAEARLSGGSFYMGSDEYEKMYVDIIKKYMLELGFSSDQVILSGLSMGTYGSLYYGCDILPHALIIGKPLASIGDVAKNERLHRPGGFPTSLDVLKFITKEDGDNAIQSLNNKFWNKFDNTSWTNTKLIVSYMIEDDYDPNAYKDLLSHVNSEGLQVYGKGIHGRHNDNSIAINQWFVSQYNKILEEDFGRGKL